MSYFSFPQWLQHWLSFLFNYNSFLATPTSSIMTHLWIWLHFNFLKCNVLHLYFIYSTFSTVPPTTGSSLELFPRFLKSALSNHIHIAFHLFLLSYQCSHSLLCHHTVSSLLARSYFQTIFNICIFLDIILDDPFQNHTLQLPRFFSPLPTPLQYLPFQFLALDKSHYPISLKFPIPLKCEWETLLNILKVSTRILGFLISTGPLALLSNNSLIPLFFSSLYWSFLFILPWFGQFSRGTEWGLKLEPLGIAPSSESL